jgi:GDP-4-dehydro-6-deoxy-D-mannose reductase
MTTKALITGIAGFAGSYLAELLVEKNYEVLGICLACESLENISHLKKEIRWFQGDVTDFDDLGRLVKKTNPDEIYHLAAFSSVGTSFEKPLKTLEVNLLGTLNLLEILRNSKKKTKLLLVGSADVYGKVEKKDLPIKETLPLNPISPYGASKACADILAYQYFKSYGLPVIRARSFNHTGPRQARGFVIPDFASQIAEIEKGYAKPLLKVGNLEAQRDVSDVKDIVSAYYLLMKKGKLGEVYNISSGKSYKIKYLVDYLLHLSEKEIKVVQSQCKKRATDISVLLGDNGKIKKEVGWSPKIPIIKTLKDTLDFWRGR